MSIPQATPVDQFACVNGHEFSSDTEALRQRHYQTWIACPECHSLDIQVIQKCAKCGEPYRESGLDLDCVCRRCGGDV